MLIYWRTCVSEKKEKAMKHKYPFEVPYTEIVAKLASFIETIFGDLQSSFLLVPRGPNFISYTKFQLAYEGLKRHTSGFSKFERTNVLDAIKENPLALIVLRSILGFTPPELAYVTSQNSSQVISQNFARKVDRQFRDGQKTFDGISALSQKRVTVIVSVACELIAQGVGEVPEDLIHRLDKADTRSGLSGIRHVANEGVPYAMLLYERFLGRPFASHRDAVSELVGETMENAVEKQLRQAGISYRKTKRAERIEGLDQAPDFIIPDEWNQQILIEAKITEDDGTARDKVTRIQHLAAISKQREAEGKTGASVIACIDGRGFGVRREDMRKLLEATEGKVFTLNTLNHLVEHTDLAKFKS
jgi:hypothetical protein